MRKARLIELIQRIQQEEQSLWDNLPEPERSRPGRLEAWSLQDPDFASIRDEPAYRALDEE
ncbi:MAG: hypothetical protein JXA37_04435 [Chloroflexia bacterium]|nr:hypothetical protein [Chloroflexia bacterium]